MQNAIDALTLLDFAIEIGQEELAALKKGEVEEAETLFARRSELMDLAIRQRDTVDPRQMRQRLLSMQALQDKLTAEGKEQRRLLAAEIGQVKQESRRHRAYGQAVRQAL